MRKVNTKVESLKRDKKLDIQRMSAEGMKPKAIAEALGISVPSVYKYRQAA